MNELNILHNQALLEKAQCFSKLKTCLLEKADKEYILTEDLSYVELRAYLSYLVQKVTDTATKHVLNTLITTLGKLEFTAVKLPILSQPARVKLSPKIIH
jgi:hypothetical protein